MPQTKKFFSVYAPENFQLEMLISNRLDYCHPLVVAILKFRLIFYMHPFSAKYKVIIDKSGCQCEGCLKKRGRKEAVKPWEHTKRAIKFIVLVVLWIIFIFLAMKVSQIEHEHVEYDPYKILGLDPVRFFGTLLLP